MPFKHSHGGHRARLRARFQKASDSLEDHELLELLLFYAIPQKDTNGLAHDLLNRFGSFRNILNADLSQLSKVPGMGEVSSQLFPVLQELIRRYLREQLSTWELKYYDPKYIGGICLPKFFNKKEEHVLALALDSNFEIVAEKEIGAGDLMSSPIDIVQFSDFVHKHKPCRIVVAHNHPSGFALPSEDDYKTTDFLRQYVASCGTRLLDHLIFDGRGDFVSLGDSDQMDGKNRFYYEVRQVESESTGEVRFVINEKLMVADIMTKKQTLKNNT